VGLASSDGTPDGYWLQVYVENPRDPRFAGLRVDVHTEYEGDWDLETIELPAGQGFYNVHIEASRHNGESGIYIAKAYVKLADGQWALAAEHRQAIAPRSGGGGWAVPQFEYGPIPEARQEFTDVSPDGYTTRIQFSPEDNARIASLLIMSYSLADGLDDAVYLYDNAEWHADGTYTVRVPVSQHGGEAGLYRTELIVWMKDGNSIGYGLGSVEVPAPAPTPEPEPPYVKPDPEKPAPTPTPTPAPPRRG
jgi:hypothetical protein